MKRLTMVVFAFLLCLLLPLSVSAAAPRLVDDADILSDAQENTLLEQLNEISRRQSVDVVVYTVASVGGASAQDAADEVFESGGYGNGADRSCILLLVGMEESVWHITTAGYGITALTDAGIEYTADRFVPYLSQGEYAQAFAVYADTCDELMDRAYAGDPFDVDDLPKKPFPAGRNFLISLVIGFIAAWIVVGKQKAQLRSVRKKAAAGEYTRQGSMEVSESRDFFLYKTVERREKANDSGGSSTHKTSSGTTVGGGGGKF